MAEYHRHKLRLLLLSQPAEQLQRLAGIGITHLHLHRRLLFHLGSVYPQTILLLPVAEEEEEPEVAVVM
jgi:hypothetical protein